MLAFKHILFPMDFSEGCCGVVPFVAALARRYGAEITLLSVSEAVYYAGSGEFGGPAVINPDLVLDDLKARLDGAELREFQGLPVRRVAELGNPAALISDFAENNGVDLIMMPTHGYGPFRRMLLGSVAAKVLHDASCPVWTATHSTEPLCRGHVACRSVLCAVDGGPQSIPLMKWAAEFAKDSGAALWLVHVIPSMQGFPSHQMDREFQESARSRVADAIGQLQSEAGVEAPLAVLSGGVAEGVAEEAGRCGANLVVAGRGARHGALGALRAHTYGIVRSAPCPVVSV
jgi:nucleotide-binding universal stress UspA family protein